MSASALFIMDLKGKRCANPCVRKSGPNALLLRQAKSSSRATTAVMCPCPLRRSSPSTCESSLRRTRAAVLTQVVIRSNDDEETVLTPVITDDGYTFVYIKHNNLFLMAVTQKNANAMLILTFLYRAVEVRCRLCPLCRPASYSIAARRCSRSISRS